MFRTSEITCGKDAPRKLSSVSFLTRGPVLESIQFVETGGSQSVRVQRYRRAIDQTLADGTPAPQASPRQSASAPAAVGVPWSVEDVIEASAKLPPDAVQAALTEGNHGFDLNRKSLLALSDAKVRRA